MPDEMPGLSNYRDTDIDFPVTVRIFRGIAFITITQHGIPKRIMTNRKGLRVIRDTIDSALDNPLSNVNGKPFNAISD